MHEGVWLKKLNIDKMTAMRTLTIFQLVLNRVYACTMIVHKQADQILPQLLMDYFDTLPAYYRHIGQLHEEISC